jgi:hypothetical protein
MDATKVGRLAMRQEGDLWVAYYAMPDTMDGAIYLGSIQMAFVESSERRKAFMGFMREAVGDLIEKTAGVRPIWPEGEQHAPESERGKHVTNPYLR